MKRKLQTKLGQLSMERVPKWDIFFSQKRRNEGGPYSGEWAICEELTVTQCKQLLAKARRRAKFAKSFALRAEKTESRGQRLVAGLTQGTAEWPASGNVSWVLYCGCVFWLRK